MFFRPRKSDDKIWSKKRLNREYWEVMSVGIIGIAAPFIVIIVVIIYLFI